MRFGIEKEYSLIKLYDNKAVYVLDSANARRELHSIGGHFLDNGWACKQEYTHSIVEFVSPIYHIDEQDNLLKDLSSLDNAVRSFNENNSCILSNQFSNVTPLFLKGDQLTFKKSDIYLDDEFLFCGDLQNLPDAYTSVDKAAQKRIYDGLISTDINFSFGRILNQDEMKIIAKTMLDVSIKYELQKSYKDNFFFDGNRLHKLDYSARDYFLNWANPNRLNNSQNICFTDPYTCRVKESGEVTVIECKNFHSCYEPSSVQKIVSDIAASLASLGFS